jgi:hypothetical protein|nr:MAG TPA: hypothetical protein [Crassvirales sp.]
MSKIVKDIKFAGLKKKDYVIEVKKEFFKHSKNEKHNETTICSFMTALPLRNVVLTKIPSKIWRNIEKRFPEVEFNDVYNSEAFIITTKGKAVCGDGDTFNERVGENIAYAKALRKAYNITSRIIAIINKEQLALVEKNQNVVEFLNKIAERETEYIKRM